MKSTTFFLKSTKAVFALVVVMMTSTALMSCSKDDGTNADNGKEIVDPKKPEEPEKPLEAPAGTVIVDGKSKPVLHTELMQLSKTGDFVLYLELSKDRKEQLVIWGNFDLHFGKNIDMSKYEKKTEKKQG